MKIPALIPIVLLVLVNTTAAQFHDIAWVRSGQRDIVLAHTLSPDGSIAVTANADRTVKFWDVATGRYRGMLYHYASVVTSLAFMPDGNAVITGGGDSTLRFWDVNSYREVNMIQESSGIRNLAVTPDGERVIVQLDNGAIHCWDITAETIVWNSTVETNGSQFHLSNNGSILTATGSADTTVYLWSTTNGSLLHSLAINSQGKPASVLASALSPDGTTLAIADRDSVRLWNTATGTIEERGAVYDNGNGPQRPSILQFFANGDSLVVLDFGGMIEIRDRYVQAPVRTLNVNNNLFDWTYWPVQITVMMDNDHLLLSGTDLGGVAMVNWPVPVMELWSLSTGKRVRSILGHSSPVAAVAFAPGGEKIISCSELHGEFKRWTAAGELESYYFLQGDMQSMNFAPDGSAGLDSYGDAEYNNSSHTYVWSTGLTSIDAGTFDRPVYGWVASGGAAACYRIPYPDNAGRSLYLWDKATKRIRGPLPMDGGDGKNSVVFAPDAARIASVSGGDIVVWNIADSAVEHVLKAPSQPVSLAWASGGSYLAAGCADGEIVIWSVWNETLMQTLHGHRGPVNAVAFCRDSRFIVSAGNDSTVRTWDVNRGINDYIYDEYPSAQRSVAVTPDGKNIVSGTEDGSVIQWQIRGAIASVEDRDNTASIVVPRIHCYPSPTNSVIRIDCDIQTPGSCSVSMIDQLGHEVTKIAAGDFECGIHHFVWNAEGFPAGVYYCRLQTASKAIITPIILMR